MVKIESRFQQLLCQTGPARTDLQCGRVDGAALPSLAYGVTVIPEVGFLLEMVVGVGVAVATDKVGHFRFGILFHDDVVVPEVKLNSGGCLRVVTYPYCLLIQRFRFVEDCPLLS